GTVAIKPDGSRVYRSNGEVWSADLQTRLGSLPAPFTSQCIAYDSSSDVVLIGCQLASGPGSVVRANGTTFAAIDSRQGPLLSAMLPKPAGTVAYGSNAAGGMEAISFARPVISSVSPSSGAFSGGQTVTITGQDFLSGATVQFGSNAAPSVSFVNSTQLIVTT